MSEDNTPSEHDTICKTSEEIKQEQEPTYSTAPMIAGLSMGPAAHSTPYLSIPRDKGKGCATSSSLHDRAHTLSRSSKEAPMYSVQADEGWDELKQSLGDWSIFTKKTKRDAVQQRKEWGDFQSKILDTYNQPTYLKDAVEQMLGTIERLQHESETQSIASDSPRALVSQALYAECRIEEGTADYERRKKAQAHFETYRPLERPRVNNIEDYKSSSQFRAEQKHSPDEQYAIKMAESRARTARRMPCRRTIGPPIRVVLGRGSRDPGEEPSDSSDNESAGDIPQDREPHGSDQRRAA